MEQIIGAEKMRKKNAPVCCNQERFDVIDGEKFWKAVQCKTIETSIILMIIDIKNKFWKKVPDEMACMYHSAAWCIFLQRFSELLKNVPKSGTFAYVFHKKYSCHLVYN